MNTLFDFGPSVDFNSILWTVNNETYSITPEVAIEIGNALIICAQDVLLRKNAIETSTVTH